MHILIYGAGGVGGFFGGKLALAGNKVTMIARGEHLTAIQENGIEVKSITGDFKASPYLATDNLSKIETPDLVIFGVKSYQIDSAVKGILQYCDENTLYLPLQNGASNVEVLNSMVPKSQVLAGLCRMISFIEAPGVISNPDIAPAILFGEQDNSKTERLEKILSVFTDAGINAAVPDNIQVAIWQKFLFITTISAIGGLTRVPIGVMREQPYINELMRKTAQEVFEVAKAKGIILPEKTIKNMFEAISKQAHETTASTQRDIMAGKPSELENFNGYIVKEGKKLGVPTPVNEMIYELLLPQEQQARQ
ncbi:ketopantoate reductase family protein [Dokdonia sp. 4H-3-7-5]|uniref:ketopantoate reductase family protein n=1 Tax=Dokdonia sp. (strain 4H-3-7-5) TaxID=983548 RepID=UPI00020A7A94|nr:2-dehydropantoate 2-reductase [Dokdonia sp. 4H-3-7-5]AEE19331.1 2-dehydropantoate 2-reductase [Dokdonia sp. 4H-3-7-5]